MEEDITDAILNIAATIVKSNSTNKEHSLRSNEPESSTPTGTCHVDGATENALEQHFIELKTLTHMDNQWSDERDTDCNNINLNSDKDGVTHSSQFADDLQTQLEPKLDANQGLYNCGVCQFTTSSKSSLTKHLNGKQCSDYNREKLKKQTSTRPDVITESKNARKMKKKETQEERFIYNTRKKTGEKSENLKRLSIESPSKSQSSKRKQRKVKEGDSHSISNAQPKTRPKSKVLSKKGSKNKARSSGLPKLSKKSGEQKTSEGVLIKTHLGDNGRLMYECNGCDYTTPFKCTLQDHMRKHSGIKPYKCSDCDYATGYRQSLRDHINFKHSKNPKVYRCKDCEYSAKSRGEVRIHRLKNHNQDAKLPFTCTKCSKSFLMRISLQQHTAANHGGEKLKCNLCDFEGNSTNVLYYHRKKIHHTKDAFKCDECEYQSFRKHQLKLHKQAVHRTLEHKCATCVDGADMSKRKFSCNWCEVRVCTSRLLMEHVIVHYIASYLKDDKYECTMCNYNTTFHSAMGRHVTRSHRGQLPFICPKCGDAKFRRDSLVRHMKISHLPSSQNAEVTNYGCSVCNRKFDNHRQLVCHNLNKHRARRWSCVRCRYETFTLEDFNCHILAHSHLHECRLCMKSFDNTQELSVHLKTDHIATASIDASVNNLLRCHVCSALLPNFREFKKHLVLSHLTEEDPFCCIVCATALISNNKLSIHLAKSHKYTKVFKTTEKKSTPQIKCSLCEFQRSQRQLVEQHIQCHFQGQFACLFCDYSTKFVQEIMSHRFEHQESNGTCFRCSHRSANSYDSISHHLKHAGSLECSLCMFDTSDENAYHEHVESKHPEQFNPTAYIRCVLCSSRMLSEMDELLEHGRLHTPGLLFECSHCSFRSSKTIILLSHFKSHAVVEEESNGSDQELVYEEINATNPIKCQFNCIVCGSPATNSTAFYQHFIRHFQMKPFKCGTCNFKIDDWAAISSHIVRCTFAFPVKCFRCGDVFHTIGPFKEHVFQHESQGECHLCDADRKNSKEALKAHLLGVHDDECVQCSLCTFITGDPYRAYIHFFKAHIQQPLLVCFICNLECQDFKHVCSRGSSQFSDESEDCVSPLGNFGEIIQPKEIRVLNLTCPECNFMSSNANSLELHILSHESSWFAHFCHLCPFVSGNLHIMERHKFTQHHTKASVIESTAVSPHQSENLFHCSACRHSKPTLSTLYRHCLMHLEKMLFRCVLCGDSFADPLTVGGHVINIHAWEICKHVCCRCDSVFDNDKLFQEHISNHISSLQCPFCAECCCNKSSLLNHLFSHQLFPSIGCMSCPYQATGESIELLQHVYAHCDFMPFKCSVCSFYGCDAQSIRQHIAVDLCKKKFLLTKEQNANESGLTEEEQRLSQSHVLPSESDRQYNDKFQIAYRCHVCKIDLTSAVSMLLHLCQDYGKKPFRCFYSNCEFDCYDLLSYTEHSRMHKPLSCNSCGIRFSSEKCCEDHRKTHALAMQCSQCDFETDNSKRYDLHSKSHSEYAVTFFCEYCSYIGSSVSAYIKHFADHVNLKLFFCDYCEYKSSSLVELQSHIANCWARPLPLFMCLICFNIQFTTLKDLERHWKRHIEKSKLGFKCPYSQWCGDYSDSHSFSSFHEHLFTKHRCIYRCLDCDQEFEMPMQFVYHRFMHSRTKEITCLEKRCDFTSTNPSDMLNHCKELNHVSHLKIKSVDPPDSEKIVATPIFILCQLANKLNLTLFQCHFCGKQTCDWRLFRAHMHLSHRTQLATIDNLKLSPSNILPESKSTTVALPSICSLCNNECAYVCRKCDRKYKSPDLLRAHRFQHTEDSKPFLCKIKDCDLRFETWKTYSIHSLRHWKSSCFRCSIVGMSGQDFRDHMECHATFNECVVCHFNAYNFNDLKLHFSKNHELYNLELEFVYRCDECRFAIADEQLFKEHLAEHLGLSLFQCKCGFSTSSLLLYHGHFSPQKITNQLITRNKLGKFRKATTSNSSSESRYIAVSRRKVGLSNIQEESSVDWSDESTVTSDTEIDFDKHLIDADLPPLTVVTRKRRKHLCSECGVVVTDSKALEEHDCQSQLKCPYCIFTTDYPRALSIHISKLHHDLQTPTEGNLWSTGQALIEDVPHPPKSADLYISETPATLSSDTVKSPTSLTKSNEYASVPSTDSGGVELLCKKPYCHFRCMTVVDMEAHIMEEHKNYQCDSCSYSSNFRTNINHHYRDNPEHKSGFIKNAAHQNSMELDVTPKISHLDSWLALSDEKSTKKVLAMKSRLLNPVVLLHDIRSTGAELEGGDEMWIHVKHEPLYGGANVDVLDEPNQGKQYRCTHCRYRSANQEFVHIHIQQEHNGKA